MDEFEFTHDSGDPVELLVEIGLTHHAIREILAEPDGFDPRAEGT